MRQAQQAPHHQQPDVSEVYVVPVEDTEDNEDTEDTEDNEDTEEQPVYVVATEDNEHLSRCNLCKDRLRLEYIQDIEEWVYTDCVEHEGVLVHQLCRDVLLS